MSHTHPSTLEDHLGYWLRCLSNYVHHSFAAKLAEHEVSVAQWVVLRVLYDQKNSTLNEIADLVGVDKSSLSRMVERLVHKGLLYRKAGGDRRSVQLTLTEVGKKLVPVLAELADENDAAFFQLLSSEERQAMRSTIKRLLIANGWDPTTRGKDRIE